MNTNYYIGFNPGKSEEIMRAWERGMLKTSTAIELLEKFGPQAPHDHKDNCTCLQAHQDLKEMEFALKDEVVDLEVNVALNK